MSNLPQQNTINQYLADGIEVNYTYSYLILLDTDIQVYVTPPGQDANPVADIKQLGVDYTVSGMGIVTGGIVTFLVAPVNGAIVTLSRNILVSIDTNFSLAQNFNGANLDAAFERVTLFTQQTRTILDTRALQYEVNTYLPNSSSNLVPTLGNGQVWSGLNGAVVATTIENDPDVSLLRSQLASQVALAEGALLVGYYDTIEESGTTVGEYLDYKDVYGNDTGSADAMILTIPNSNFKYANGQNIHIIPANTNLTTTPTLNVNGKGAVLIKRSPSGSCQAGDLTAGVVVSLLYDSNANEFYITNIFIPTIASANPTIQILTGSGNYVPPPGVTYFIVEGVGGGAGSGGSATGSAGNSSAGAGGSGGGYFYKLYSVVGASYTYAVGAAGVGGVSGGGTGTDGGDTTFDTCIGEGGLGGIGSIASGSGANVGKNGGLATGGDINIPGEPGGTGYWTFNNPIGGKGGASKLGYGGVATAGTSDGQPGTGNGSGGSGSNSRSLSSNKAGADGSIGTIIVYEYYT